MKSVLHRISAKRVIIEITDSQKLTRARRRYPHLIAITGGVVLVLGAISSLSNIATSSSDADGVQMKTAAQNSVPTAPASCQKVSTIAGVEIKEMAKFEVGPWNFRTYTTARALGSVWFVNFEAECSGQIVDGLLTAEQTVNGYRILRMTPT